MKTTVREYNDPARSNGEYRLVLESCLRGRQPATIPWCAWKAMYTPAVDEALVNNT